MSPGSNAPWWLPSLLGLSGCRCHQRHALAGGPAKWVTLSVQHIAGAAAEAIVVGLEAVRHSGTIPCSPDRLSQRGLVSGNIMQAVYECRCEISYVARHARHVPVQMKLRRYHLHPKWRCRQKRSC